jgi:cystathionine beta-lyase
MSPSKTFNMAALSTAYVIISNNHLKKQYDHALEYHHLQIGNVFGHVALEAAYNYGSEWLDQMLDYVHGNIQHVSNFLNNKLPDIKIIQPEGTYLIWIDFNGIGLKHSEINKSITRKARVGLNDGITFGPGGYGFLRMNVACPRVMVEEAMERIFKTFY